jgi:hypothetical protein
MEGTIVKHLLICLLAVIVLGVAGCEVDVDDDLDIVLGDQRQPMVNTEALHHEHLDITVEW